MQVVIFQSSLHLTFAAYKTICFGAHTVLEGLQYDDACSGEGMACAGCGVYGFKRSLVHLYMVLSSAHILYDLHPKYLRTTAFSRFFWWGFEHDWLAFLQLVFIRVLLIFSGFNYSQC